MVRWVLIVLLCSATLAVAQEREWSLGASGEDVFLAFGVPETADIGVSFWCKIGAQDVSVFAPLPPADAQKADVSKVVLDAGARTFPLSANVIEDSSVEGRLVPQGDVLAALKASDRFALTVGAHKTTYPLEGADFDGLLAMCANKDGAEVE
jgi:hypothetical protein